jgi:hypothetical protein
VEQSLIYPPKTSFGASGSLSGRPCLQMKAHRIEPPIAARRMLSVQCGLVPSKQTWN